MLVAVFVLLFDVLVQERPPVHDQQAVGVVVGAGDPPELTGRHQLPHQDAAPALDPLPAVVGEFHVLRVHPDGVAVDAEHGARSHDIRIEAFLLEGVVLRKACLVHEVHGLLHRVLDVLVIRGEREEIVVEHLHVALRLDLQCLVHGASLHEDRDVAVQDVHFLVCVGDHPAGREDTCYADDDAAQQEQSANDPDQLDLVFQILDYHISFVSVVI